MIVRVLFLNFMIFIAAGVMAEAQMNHGMDHSEMNDEHQNAAIFEPIPTEPGQSAFAAIQEIVRLLEADQNTDWTQVNIEQLRQHLIDMENVTLRARVTTDRTDKDVRFGVSSDNPDVINSIQRMVSSHVLALGGTNEQIRQIADGVVLTLKSTDAQQQQKLVALGFIGWLASGMQHQTHHLALARGQNTH